MTRGGNEGGLVAEESSGGDMVGGEAVRVAMLGMFLSPPVPPSPKS